MKWINLKLNACPNCGRGFNFYSFQEKGLIRCGNCDFSISEKRYSEIVNSQITKQLEDKWDKEEGGEDE